jgi:hypothetical protein
MPAKCRTQRERKRVRTAGSKLCGFILQTVP